MENVVPGALQRLRAADIIRMAGLSAASLGQEYYRAGAVRNTERQGAHLSGIVDVLHTTGTSATLAADDVESISHEGGNRGRYAVEFEMQSPTSWVSSCSCSVKPSSLLCSHTAALLYCWLAQPAAFVSPSTSTAPTSSSVQPAMLREEARVKQESSPLSDTRGKTAQVLSPPRTVVVQRGPTPLNDLLDMLVQLGLSELRGIAREYDIMPNGKNKQQLAEAILAVLKQPEAVRRVAMTLEKPQRQLLAALTLAGGSVTDDDLRGIYERFSLGHPNQLQGILVVLQGKALLFRTSMNSSPVQRIGLSGALLDVGWYVPMEVRTALRVTVPVTPFDKEKKEQAEEEGLRVQQGEPLGLLADLLLVARALDGGGLEYEKGSEPTTAARPASTLSSDGSVEVPPPADMPSPAQLAALQNALSRPPAFLQFALRLLRLADILHRGDDGTSAIHILPNAARLLLGNTRTEVARDLFELWLAQASYDELYELREDGLRLRCRATSQNQPVLRAGELEAENSEARQTLVALLAQVPLHQWISFPAFARFVYRLTPLFLQKRQRFFSSPHWWLELEEGRPLRPLQLNDWMHAEAYYLAHLLQGPLLWWGVCDTILSRDGRLLAFRLTSFAGWLFGEGELEDEVPELSREELAASLEVVDEDALLVPCSASYWPVIDTLETFAEAAGVRQRRLCYRPGPKTLSAALSRGQSPAPLLELLRALAQGAGQQNELLLHLLHRLERWMNNYGPVRLYTGVTLLETADAMVMRELAATTSINTQIVQTVQPTLHILKKTGVEQLVDELKRRGLTPLLHDEETYGSE